MEQIIPAEYQFDSAKRIWLKKDAPAFSYSDGDSVENGIGKILAAIKDKSVYSDELKAAQTNWPTAYYFSANRANLLRSLNKKLTKNARALELGCGMGAITRYLGENASEVIAVEGSARRGSIAALRCEDLPNVHVVVDEIKALPKSLGKFDIVTLIGVLEYARRYGGSGAEMEVLKKAKSFLKPDGILVLAIENKLGLKYFAGVPEDHIPRPWIGITNGYEENGARTWSRKELMELLQKAGFDHCEQFLALPDYKMPTTIVTPEGINSSEIDLKPILNQTRRLFEAEPLFNTAEAWESVCTAGLLPDLADSLCFIASSGGESAFTQGELVNHYGQLSSLPHKYAKEVKIIKSDAGIRVKRRKMREGQTNHENKLRQQVGDEPYLRGELLFSKIRKIAMRKDWTLEDFFQAFDPWVNMLKENADENLQCDGHLLDLTPFNIMMDGGAAKSFDLEWVYPKKLPLAFLLYRGFYHTLLRMMPLRKSSAHNAGAFSTFLQGFMARQNLPSDHPANIDYLWWQEVKFAREIKNNPRISMPKDFKILYTL